MPPPQAQHATAAVMPLEFAAAPSNAQRPPNASATQPDTHAAVPSVEESRSHVGLYVAVELQPAGQMALLSVKGSRSQVNPLVEMPVQVRATRVAVPVQVISNARQLSPVMSVQPMGESTHVVWYESASPVPIFVATKSANGNICCQELTKGKQNGRRSRVQHVQLTELQVA